MTETIDLNLQFAIEGLKKTLECKPIAKVARWRIKEVIRLLKETQQLREQEFP